MRLPTFSQVFHQVEEVFSELSSWLKMMHHAFLGEPDAQRHALAIAALRAEKIGTDFQHSILEAIRNIPELAGPEGPKREAFEPFQMQRKYSIMEWVSEIYKAPSIVEGTT